MMIFAPNWVELSIVVPLVGAAGVSRLRNPDAAYRWCLVVTGAALACAVLAWTAFLAGIAPQWTLFPVEIGASFAVDEFSAPLLPIVALLHFLTALATARTKMGQFSFALMLVGETLRLATFACVEPWILTGLLIAGTAPPLFELRNRQKPTRVYVLHMGVFVALLLAGWICAANWRSGAEWRVRCYSGRCWCEVERCRSTCGWRTCARTARSGTRCCSSRR